MFEVYTEANCRYDCQVRLASEICKCSPWDFLNVLDIEECDVFGRICFHVAMNNLTNSPFDRCGHCIEECDFIEFKKDVLSQNPVAAKPDIDSEEILQALQMVSMGMGIDMDMNMDITGKYINYDGSNFKGKKEFIDYFNDTDNTFQSKAYKLIGLSTSRDDQLLNKARNSIIIHLKFMQPEIDFIDVKYTLMDKLATFGGNFGIFEMVTGWSLFGILNLTLLIFKCLFKFNN